MLEDARLLKTQKNELLPFAKNSGFESAEFRWEEDNRFEEKRLTTNGRHRTWITNNLLASVLVHVPSGFYCKFGRETLFVSPGENSLTQTLYTSDRQAGFQQWLAYLQREVRSADSWELMRDGALERLKHAECGTTALARAGKHTAASELGEANADLLRRQPDLTGAVQHSLAALECVAREYCGDQATFGKLLERYSDLFPKPLDKGIEKIWGFASEMGRHLREGRTPSEEEAELLVGLAVVCCTYLARKIKAGDE